jgi:hypothetical protein
VRWGFPQRTGAVAYAPKAVWARLTRGPEPEESPGARLIERVRYNQAKDRFGEWIANAMGPVRNFTSLFDGLRPMNVTRAWHGRLWPTGNPLWGVTFEAAIALPLPMSWSRRREDEWG